jgi:hypothetical protein
LLLLRVDRELRGPVYDGQGLDRGLLHLRVKLGAGVDRIAARENTIFVKKF